MKIKISIIVCTFNSEKYLNDCLRSLFIKNNSNYEIVVIDDKSEDKTLKILKKWKKKFTHFQVIPLKKNRGISYCRNLGIKKTNGEYISFCDSDDFYSQNSLSLMLKNVNLFKEYDLFFYNHKVLNNLSKKNISKSKLSKNINFSYALQLNKTITPYTRWNIWSLLIKKDFLKKNNIFFKNQNQNEDWVFNFNLSLIIKKFKIINHNLYNYRFHEISSLGKKGGYIISFSRLMAIINFLKLIKTYKKNFNNDLRKLFMDMKNICISDFLINFLTLDKIEENRISKILKRNKRLFYKNKNIINNNEFFMILKNIKKNKKIINKFNHFVNSNFNENSILFCAGFVGRTVLDKFQSMGFTPKIILDNNSSYKKQKLKGVVIQDLKYLRKKFKIFKNSSILICNLNFKDVSKIKQQLINARINRNNIFNLKNMFI